MKKLKEKMIYLGLNPKKEFLVFGCFSFVLIALSILSFFLLKEITFPIAFVLVLFLFSFIYFTRYGKRIDAENMENLKEFATLFSYFKIYIGNGFSVYSSLKEIESFANPSLKKMLDELMQEIDNDKTIQPFVKFGKKFNEIVVEEMMISIYQLIDDGGTSENLLQFEMIFDKFSDLLREKELAKKNSKLGTLSSAPLIGSCFLIVILTIGIISIIGELINGL